jgi:hypothetical protein
LNSPADFAEPFLRELPGEKLPIIAPHFFQIASGKPSEEYD